MPYAPDGWNGEVAGKGTVPEGNRIRIRVDNDELATPLVEHGRIRSFRLDGDEVDLK